MQRRIVRWPGITAPGTVDPIAELVGECGTIVAPGPLCFNFFAPASGFGMVERKSDRPRELAAIAIMLLAEPLG